MCFCVARVLLTAFQRAMPGSRADWQHLAVSAPMSAGVKLALDRFAPFRSLAACHVWASLNNERGGYNGTISYDN